MNSTFLWTIGAWVLGILLVAGVYQAYLRLLSDKAKLAISGFKTKTFGAVVTVAPDIVTLLSSVQGLGLEDYAPTPGMKMALHFIGPMIILLRLISDHENDI